MSLWILIAALLQLRPVTWSVQPPQKPIVPGSTVSIALVATIDDGWHLYSTTQPAGGPIPTSITVAPSSTFSLSGPVSFPKPAVTADPNFGINVETYDRHVAFTIPLKVANNAVSHVENLTVRARFQACNANLCMPPRTETVTFPLTVRGGVGQ